MRPDGAHSVFLRFFGAPKNTPTCLEPTPPNGERKAGFFYEEDLSDRG
jgi:hypothetical protein